jgi:hypothetical protein
VQQKVFGGGKKLAGIFKDNPGLSRAGIRPIEGEIRVSIRGLVPVDLMSQPRAESGVGAVCELILRAEP